MDIATGSWFEYLNEEVRLDEGLRDIGLPEVIADAIEDAMPNASEKGKMWMGKQWKVARMYVQRSAESMVFSVVNSLIDELGDYRPPAKGLEGDVEMPASVRDQWEKLKFVIENVKGAVQDRPFGAWAKVFKKAAKNLSKQGIPSEKVDEITEMLSATLRSTYDVFHNNHEEVFAFLNDHPANYEEVKEFGTKSDAMMMADGAARRYFREKEDPANIIHIFDDGSYWYNLRVSNCPIEAARMAHCGSDSRGVMVSLRRPKEKRKAGSASYVTMTWNEDEGILYQIKGRENAAPPEKIWPRISWFVENMNVRQIFEQGEHSDDQENLRKMVDWLGEQNPDVTIPNNMKEMIDALQEELDEVLSQFEDMEYCWLEATATDPGDLDMNELNQPVIEYGAICTMEIPLGWEEFKFNPRSGVGYIPTRADGRTRAPNLKTIPPGDPSWGMSSEDTEFLEESGLHDLQTELPGEDKTINYEIKMMGPPFPVPYTHGDPEPEPIAHLKVEFRLRGDYGDGEASAFEWFADQVKSEFEDEYEALREAIRARLAKSGYATRTPWDKERQSLEDLGGELNPRNFQLFAPKSDLSQIEYWLKAPTGEVQIEASQKLTPDVFNYYPFSAGETGRGTGWAGRPDAPTSNRFLEYLMLPIAGANFQGYRNRRGLRPHKQTDKFESPDLNRTLGQELVALNHRAIRAAAQGQTELPFGDKYKRQPPPPLSLVDDIRLTIQQKGPITVTTPHTIGMSLTYEVRVGINSRSSAEEIEKVKGFMKFLDENVDMVREAAEEVILVTIIETLNDAAANHREKIDDGTYAKAYATMSHRRYAREAEVGTGDAEKGEMMTDWLTEKWDNMGGIERYIATDLLRQLANRDLALYQTDIEMEDPNNIGMPIHAPWWRLEVRNEMRLRGVPDMMINKYQEPVTGAPRHVLRIEDPPPGPAEESPEEPLVPRERLYPAAGDWRRGPVNESAEEQIERVERLLSEKDPTYDLRLYKVQVHCGINNDLGGEAQEVQTEIRGIAGVTTVRSIGETVRETPQQTFVTMEVKFELLGRLGRVRFRDEVLIPGLMKIKGLKILRISPIHRTNIKGSIRTVRESFGNSGPTGFFPQEPMLQKMNTPRSGLEDALADWVEGSVMAYDVAVNTMDMRYHVMMPVKELLPYISREFRAPMDAFDGMYQHFIANGAEAPVFVALGKNGRIKITGNEDIVWFAKRSGLEEVPVFLSYQNQA